MWLDKVIPKISSWTGTIAGIIIAIVSLIIGYDVFLHIVFDSVTSWGFEISTYGLVWFSFLSAAFVLIKNRHIHVEILVDRFNPKTKMILRVFSLGLIVFYVSVLCYYFGEMALNAYITDERAPTLARTPMYLVFFGGLIGLTSFFLQSIHSFVKDLIKVKRIEDKAQVLPLALFLVALVVSIVMYFVNHVVGLIMLLFTLLSAGVPVFAVLGVVGSMGLIILTGVDIALPQMAQIAYKSVNSNVLLAIPLFILSGVILQRGQIGNELYSLATAWIGHLKGGYGIATILACGIFAAISGSSVATAAAIGIIAIPEMLKRNYKATGVYGLLASGGTLGMLIPPSTPMILYGGMTNESTGQLFMGGVVPGILVMTLFGIFTYLTTSEKTKAPVISWQERWKVTKNSIWGLLMPVIVLSGIYLGIFTPTQAGAVAVLYAAIVSFVRKKVKLKDIPSILADGTLSSGMIMMIIVGAIMLGQVVTLLKIPDGLVNYVVSNELQVWLVLAVITLGYIILGMFMEVVSIMLITLPVVYPLIISMGVDGLWFGIYMVMLMELALITPPVGLNLFVIKDIGKTNVASVIRGSWIYALLLAVAIVLITVFPELVLWLPNKMYGN